MRKFLLYSSALVLGLSGAAQSACIQTPTCSSLGYTSSSSCTGGVKCPFGNAWNCTVNEIKTELTNKITELETQITELKKEVATSNCLEGDILFSDMTCNQNLVSGKTPIGVVFDRDKKLAIGLTESMVLWSILNFDVLGLNNITDITKALQDLDGKKNTSIILAYCQSNGKSCPAVEYVNSYKTEGTLTGDWYLPALGELDAIYDKKDLLNMSLVKVGGVKLSDYYYWSSSEYSIDNVWGVGFSYGGVDNFDKYGGNYYVRPVLAF